MSSAKMHNSVLLALWAGVSYILYQIIATVIDSRRHAAAARRLNCQPAPNMKVPGILGHLDFLGLEHIAKVLTADKEYRIPQYLQGRFHDAGVKEGRRVTTTSSNLMGAMTHFTIEPKNIQAVLATQFKDFGLGERRNGNFSQLLGHGIVSSISPTDQYRGLAFANSS